MLLAFSCQLSAISYQHSVISNLTSKCHQLSVNYWVFSLLLFALFYILQFKIISRYIPGTNPVQTRYKPCTCLIADYKLWAISHQLSALFLHYTFLNRIHIHTIYKPCMYHKASSNDFLLIAYCEKFSTTFAPFIIKYNLL